MRKLLLLLTLTGLLFGQGVEFNIIEIPNSELVDNTTIPSLYNGTIAWHDGTYDGALYYWDGDTTSLVGSGCFGNLSLYDGKIAFQHNEGVNNGTRVYYWDGSTTENISGDLYANSFSLYNGEIAFSGSGSGGVNDELYYWDGTTTTQLTNGGCGGTFIPSLFDGAIAWLNCDVLYYWDGDTTTLVYDDSYVYWNPSLYNGEIAFAANDGNDFEIYLWDGTNIIQITDNNVDDKHPSLYDGKIAWRNGNSDETYEIFYWNGTNTFQVTNNDIYDGPPSLYGGNIAWNGGSGWLGTGKIYYALQAHALWYVSTTGSDETGDGSEESPFATIQDGIDAASDGDTVLVAAGTYVENINYNGKNISVIGEDRETTIIDGNQFGSVVEFENGEDITAVLSGFTLKNGGSVNYGGGIYCFLSSPTLKNLIIKGNGGVASGGGMYCNDSSPNLNNVTVTGNSAGYGSGLFSSSSNLSLMNVSISGNSASSNGGGIYSTSSNLSLVNCILWDDSPQEIYFNYNGSLNSFAITYSDIQGEEAGIVTNNNATVYWEGGNIDEDPLFCNPDSSDYTLKENSPCVGTGENGANMGAFGVGCGSIINVPADYTTIQVGIDAAGDGDTVLVQPGTYVENINYNGKNIVVGSLYLTTSDTSYISSTIIDGNQIGRVVIIDNSAIGSLIGMKIINGSGINGGGIRVYGGEPYLSNLILENNYAAAGAALNLHSCNPRIENVKVFNNTSSSGIIYLSSSDAIINNSIISNNQGSGIYASDSNPVLNNVLISNNTASSGGAIYCMNGSSMILRHVTSVLNSASNNGDGFYIWGDNTSVDVYNSILWDDESDEVNIGIGGSFSTTYTNIQGGYAGTGNIDANPYFVDSANGNYRLADYSPCIGAGLDTSIVDTTDIEGNPRPNPAGSNPDMGAYENALGTPTYLPQVVNVPADYTAIQAALTAAIATDTVLVQPGTYTENIIWPETNGIKLISAGDSSNTIIDGGGVSSVIYMNPQSATIDTTTIIEGFTLTNGGEVANGGGLFINNANIQIISCVFTENNSTYRGGGIYLENSNSIIKNIIVDQNIGAIEGGGIFLFNSDPVISHAIIVNNESLDGGGIRILGGSPELNHLTINNNHASYSGGGIDIYSSDLTMNSSLIKGNTSDGQGGGGIRVGDSFVSLIGSKIINNNANGVGGGLDIYSGEMIFEDLEISYNNATIGGGIKTNAALQLSNVRLINNHALEKGGGMYVGTGEPVFIEHVRVINNNGQYGGGFYFENSYDINITLTTLINNSALNGDGGAIYCYDSYIDANYLNVINNVGNGIYLDVTSQSTFQNSNFSGNNYAIYNINNSNFSSATNNWWNHASGPYHPSQNPSGEGDSVNTLVNVTPWLTTPNTDAPPIPAQNLTVTGTGNDFISLNWDVSLIGDLAGYKLYYDSDSSGYPYTNSVDIGTDTSYTLSGLTLGTTFYLAVTTYDTDGNESWYSNEVTGTTRVMQAQSLNIGGNEDLQHLITHTPAITFGYYDSMNEAQTNYQVQVSTDSTFSSVNMWDAGSVSSDTTSVTYAGTALVDGTTYYLRVRVASGDFWSDWSALSFRMNTEPTTPVLVSPINNQVSGTPVGLKVLNATDAESDAITYSYNVYSDVSLTTKLDSATAVTEGTDTTSWQITATLPDNGQYFWTVSTNDGYEESAVSDAGSFLLNTDNNAPEAFTLSMPLVDTEVQNLSPVFSWHPAHDPDPIDTVHYTLMLDTPDPGVEVFDVGTDTSFQVTNPLMDNTEYFWQVMAEDVIGFQTINEGGYQTFYTNVSNDPPSVSTLVAPLNGSIQTDLTPNFYWTEAVDPDPLDNVSYTMNWWPLGVLPYIISINTDSTGVSPDEDIPDNAQFGWMVVANDMYDSQSTSDTSYFYSDAFPEPPLNFATVAPANNVEGLATDVEFVWEETDDPDPIEEISYRVVYASNWEDSSNYVYSETIQDTSMVITLGDNSQYYWLVEALDSDGFIVGSNDNTPNAIVVGTLAIDGDLIPVEFALRQNYPNPFNPLTTLRYDLPENGLVNITIYDMMGRQVKTLINGSQTAGYKTIQWNATNNVGQPVSAGIYLYQIQAGEYISTKKMVLLK